MKTIKKAKCRWFITSLLTVSLLAGCGFLDPTDVTNPNTTEESLRAGASGATLTFLYGVRRELSQSIARVAIQVGANSDSYRNGGVSLGGHVDYVHQFFPILASSGHSSSLDYTSIPEIWALATFAIETVAPNDDKVTDEIMADLYFHRGLAYLIQVESYWAAPVAEDEPVKTMRERLQLALADFDRAESLGLPDATRVHIVQARTHRLLGDKQKALVEVLSALNGPSNFNWMANNDRTGTTNALRDWSYTRQLMDLQPLPRLDFLDPKYVEQDQGIPIAKMEEAHLIHAEILLSDGDYEGAKQALAAAVTVAKQRMETDSYTYDENDIRTAARADYPLLDQAKVADMLVKASPASPALPDLMIPRVTDILVNPVLDTPGVSGTSLDPDEVLALPHGTVEEKEELLRLVYLSRQEIFFYEGRRLADLGIRKPVDQEEIDQNTTMSEGGDGTYVYVPDFIPAISSSGNLDALDHFTYDAATNTVIIDFDLNYLIAKNRNRDFNPPGQDLSATSYFTFPF